MKSRVFFGFLLVLVLIRFSWSEPKGSGLTLDDLLTEVPASVEGSMTFVVYLDEALFYRDGEQQLGECHACFSELGGFADLKSSYPELAFLVLYPRSRLAEAEALVNQYEVPGELLPQAEHTPNFEGLSPGSKVFVFSSRGELLSLLPLNKGKEVERFRLFHQFVREYS